MALALDLAAILAEKPLQGYSEHIASQIMDRLPPAGKQLPLIARHAASSGQLKGPLDSRYAASWTNTRDQLGLTSRQTKDRLQE
jgi:hypothetical protein